MKIFIHDDKTGCIVKKYRSKLKDDRLYRIWMGMKNRCDSPTSPLYYRYGGRGITYDPRWANFSEFEKDMRPLYVLTCQLDRIDNNGGYFKENCRFVSQKVQNNNRRDNIYITSKGMTKTLAQWAEFLRIGSSTLRQRYFVYKWEPQRCLIPTIRKGAKQIGQKQRQEG